MCRNSGRSARRPLLLPYRSAPLSHARRTAISRSRRYGTSTSVPASLNSEHSSVVQRFPNEIFRAADAFYERRHEGTISFHPKSSRDLRSGVEKQHSGGEVQRSTFAGFSGSLDFRLLQQYLPRTDIGAWMHEVLNDTLQV